MKKMTMVVMIVMVVVVVVMLVVMRVITPLRYIVRVLIALEREMRVTFYITSMMMMLTVAFD